MTMVKVNKNVRYFVADRIVSSLRTMRPTLSNNQWARFVECLNSIIGSYDASIKSTVCTMRPDAVRIIVQEVDGIDAALHASITGNVYTLYTPAWGENWEHETIYSCEMQDQALSEELVRQGVDLYPEHEVV